MESLQRVFVCLLPFLGFVLPAAEFQVLNSVMPLSVDRERLMEVALRVYPEIASSLCANIADSKSYERIEIEQGRIGINRYDFYGYRRKIVDIYNNTEG